jgi:FkbM family methyltransferase
VILPALLSDSMKVRLRHVLARLGIEIGAYAGSFANHRAHLLVHGGVLTVWDVGAHVGQYGSRLRDHDYRDRIISIEPNRAAFEELSRRASRGTGWTAVPLAVSDSARRETLNVSANGQSSSLLPITRRHTAANHDSRYVGTEIVQTVTLDSLRVELSPPAPFYVKLDVQGGELAALRGAPGVLRETAACEVELSFAELYKGGATWQEVSAYLDRAGFTICDVERVFFDPVSKDLLQINALYHQ